jgi:hypothetical protein
MKQKMIFMALACLLLSAVAAFAQSKTDFSGDWTLDVSKSKLPEMRRIESGSLTVKQTDNDISVAASFKSAPNPNGAAGAAGNGGGGMRGSGGNQALTYTFDGKETTVDVPGPQGTTSAAKLKSSWDGAKLKLTNTRNFTTQMGDVTVTMTETWESVEGGKALKVTRLTQSPRGDQTAEFYYTKK